MSVRLEKEMQSCTEAYLHTSTSTCRHASGSLQAFMHVRVLQHITGCIIKSHEECMHVHACLYAFQRHACRLAGSEHTAARHDCPTTGCDITRGPHPVDHRLLLEPDPIALWFQAAAGHVLNGLSWLAEPEVFVAIYQLKLRPPSSWLELMQNVLLARQQQDDSDPALKPATSWLDALKRLK
eukprot:1156104-Pelagomonas_calceolata.AAC.4